MVHEAPRRYLTKSRFTLAVECPTKLYYTGKPQYANRLADDAFMAALADGGFQVGELAKLMYPGGIEVETRDNEEALAHTAELLKQHTVTLYEAAIAHGPFLVRVDILKKVGDEVELIEVKAKSYSSKNAYAFKGKKGGWDKAMLPYLQDVAFQRFVLGQAHPHWRIKSFLMLVDKERTCSVNGLNQKFRIQRLSDSRQRVVVQPGTRPDSIGAPILTAENVDKYIDALLAGSSPGIEGSLSKVAKKWAAKYQADRRMAPVIGAHCAGCEFRADATSALTSGFHECWDAAKGWTREKVDAGTVLDIWSFQRKQELIDKGILALDEVKEEDIRPTEKDGGLSTSQRQWMQVSGRWPGGGEFYLDRRFMRAEMAAWTFPLHFIDFETARVAIPFYAGRKPYANIAFQFSHHTVDRNGTVAHANEYLGLEPGQSPNYEFTRRLKEALGDAGTIFMWTGHENTTLNAILAELEGDRSPPADAAELTAFLQDVTRKKGEREGSRAMYDLCDLAKKAFFHPATNASSSIKKLLPAVMAASPYLRQRYSQPIYGTDADAGGIASKNFRNHVWWQTSPAGPVHPYEQLPPVFDDLPPDVMASLDADDEAELANGGAATTAWTRIQFDDTPGLKRDKIAEALKRYCELDTLAMVMIYEAWKDWL